MSLWTNSDGEILIPAGGAPYECDECPCACEGYYCVHMTRGGTPGCTNQTSGIFYFCMYLTCEESALYPVCDYDDMAPPPLRYRWWTLASDPLDTLEECEDMCHA